MEHSVRSSEHCFICWFAAVFLQQQMKLNCSEYIGSHQAPAVQGDAICSYISREAAMYLVQKSENSQQEEKELMAVSLR